MLKSKSPTNKKLCGGVCGLKIPKHGKTTCGDDDCVNHYKVEQQVKKGIELLEKKRRKEKRELIKKERQIVKEKKESFKSIGQLLATCQTHVNKYIRERDKDKPCASCGEPLQRDKIDAGHYIPRGKDGCATAVRFAYGNIFNQCVTCNRFGFPSHEYKRNIEARHGEGVFEPLERYYDEIKKTQFKPDREWVAIIQKHAIADLKDLKANS